ncbi:MAG: methyltransferase domain-containing protein [bacterium]|nr:methyltransferase domain-containing protein [bacterium]
MPGGAKQFYEAAYEGESYASRDVSQHRFFGPLQAFVAGHGLDARRCLEIGSGRGRFQDVVPDYLGTDLAESAGRYYHKPFVPASATALPFADGSFDALWTTAVLEHIPDPASALAEMRRVVKPDGLLLLGAAWQCRPWAAEGYAVRPYGDFGMKGKLIKASIVLRKTVVFRSSYVFPRRLLHALRAALSRGPVPFRYRELEPNYEKFWVSDSDAVNSMDPYDAILWFESRGDRCLNYTGGLSKFFVRTGPLVFRIRK